MGLKLLGSVRGPHSLLIIGHQHSREPIRFHQGSFVKKDKWVELCWSIRRTGIYSSTAVARRVKTVPKLHSSEVERLCDEFECFAIDNEFNILDGSLFFGCPWVILSKSLA